MELLTRARGGDDAAFGALVEPFRRELYVHVYRMLGSVQDAEDVLQETLTAAWRGLDGFAERASLRTWLYRIATNRCLNWLRDGQRRPRAVAVFAAGVVPPEPTRRAEPAWLQPIPDALLSGLPDTQPGPEARYEQREAVSLAFVATVQTLPPRQRAVLLLRDVLGYRAAEAAAMLELTEDATNALLKRARAAVMPPSAGLVASPRERESAARFADAIEAGDVDAMLALLTDDAWLTMPPAPHEYQGHAAIGAFMRQVGFRGGRRYRLVPAGANGQPAFGTYILGDDGGWRAHGMTVLTMRGELVSAFTRFRDDGIVPYFGLPDRL